MKQSKNLQGGREISKGSHNPSSSTPDSSGKATNKEASAANPKDSAALGPMKGGFSGVQNYTSDAPSTEKSLSHPKASDAMKTHRV